MPASMYCSLVTPVYKIGDPFAMGNFRPIAATEPIMHMRLYAGILHARLVQYTEGVGLPADLKNMLSTTQQGPGIDGGAYKYPTNGTTKLSLNKFGSSSRDLASICSAILRLCRQLGHKSAVFHSHFLPLMHQLRPKISLCCPARPCTLSSFVDCSTAIASKAGSTPTGSATRPLAAQQRCLASAAAQAWTGREAASAWLTMTVLEPTFSATALPGDSSTPELHSNSECFLARFGVISNPPMTLCTLH